MHVRIKVGVNKRTTLGEERLQIGHGYTVRVNVPHFQLPLGKGSYRLDRGCLLDGLGRRVLNHRLHLFAARSILL